MSAKTPVLRRLEAESIYILREVAGQFERPVLLYSIGKNFSVLTFHLAKKAFHPARPPFPVLHVDTTWKFREMIAFRDQVLPTYGMELIVHANQDGIAKGIGPFSHGSALHTEIMKTQALRQALERHGFDAAIGGARRDEEKSRAKERIFSFRSATHQWDPKSQRPELWQLYNGLLHPGESMRIFPLVKLDRARCLALHRGGANTQSCRCISPSLALWSSARACSSWLTMTACRFIPAKARSGSRFASEH